MPIQIHADTRRLDQQEFGRIAYDVMDHVFAVHNEMGRFFDENIYRNAVASLVARSQTEVLVEVRFEDFRKDYYLDLLVDGGAVDVLDGTGRLGTQKLRLAGPRWAFKVTAIDSAGQSRFEEHVHRFLKHTSLHGIQWINITRKHVMFKTVEK